MFLYIFFILKILLGFFHYQLRVKQKYLLVTSGIAGLTMGGHKAEEAEDTFPFSSIHSEVSILCYCQVVLSWRREAAWADTEEMVS